MTEQADSNRPLSDGAKTPADDYSLALDRLKARLVKMRAADAAGADALGPASHPAADFARLARQLGRSAPAHLSEDAPETLPGPATINILAERIGFEVHWETRLPGSLQPAELPALLLLRNQTSRLVTGLPGAGTLRILGPDGPYTVECSALDKVATGTVCLLRDVASSAGVETAEAAPAKAFAPPSPAPASGGQTLALAQTAPVAPRVSIIGMLGSALAGQRLRIAHLFIASFLINLLGMALPLFSMAVFDRVIPHAAFETLWALALGVSLALGLEMLLRHARMKLMDAVSYASSLRFQGRLMSRLLFARTSDLPKSAGGVVPAAQELDQSAHLAPQLLISLAVDLPFFLLMMLFIGMIGGSVVIVPLIGTMVLILLHAITHMLAQKGFREHVGQSRRQMQHLIDAITGAERVRITNAGETLISSWEATADKAGYAAHLGRYWQGLAAQGGAIIVQAVVVGTVVIGAYRVQDAAMTIGALSATILLVNRAMMPVSILAGLIFRALQLGESLVQAAPLMQASIERASDMAGAPVQTAIGKIDIHKVTFSYAGENRTSLHEVSLTIRPNERIGIIGKAGCGKSTLLRLIARLHEPTEGRVLLDERDIRHYDPVTLRQAIALMPQEACLLDLSLHENLTIGLDPIEQEHFDRVVRLTGVHDFASIHPSGYSLAVGAGGQRLSGGERQAVSLARALMARPRLLLLDEPTSAMDNGAEMRFVSEMKKPDMAGFGLVIATHRLPALALVDRIIWLDRGRIVADGPKEQVFAKLGIAA